MIIRQARNYSPIRAHARGKVSAPPLADIRVVIALVCHCLCVRRVTSCKGGDSQEVEGGMVGEAGHNTRLW